MANPALTNLIPIQELTPGAVGAIRNQVINALVAQASSELSLTPEKLVVRDVRPKGDLTMYGVATTAVTVEDWTFEPTGHAANTWLSATGAQTIADQRYVALYGVRNLGLSLGLHATLDTITTLAPMQGAKYQPVAQIKVNVGGADKVIWDIRSIGAYPDSQVAFAPAAVVIPQNTAYNIYYQWTTASPGVISRIQLIGIVVEPRGKLISP